MSIYELISGVLVSDFVKPSLRPFKQFLGSRLVDALLEELSWRRGDSRRSIFDVVVFANPVGFTGIK